MLEAMSLYTISLQPLITLLNSSTLTKQCWYADDAAGAGPLRELRKWWDMFDEMGPSLGYYPNSKTCWLLTKPGKEDAAREVFHVTAINISTQGQKHLGTVLGSRAYWEEKVNGKVERSSCQVSRICCDISTSFIRGLHIRAETSLDLLS